MSRLHGMPETRELKSVLRTNSAPQRRRVEKWSTAHLGQGLVCLLRGAAVSLGHVTEGEGHVLQREVANE